MRLRIGTLGRSRGPIILKMRLSLRRLLSLQIMIEVHDL
jgi:hypothetical protein